MKLPPSIETHSMSPSSQLCGQICLDLPGSAWIFRIMGTKMGVADILELLEWALPLEMQSLSQKKFFLIIDSWL
jgi:hypothetical protein